MDVSVWCLLFECPIFDFVAFSLLFESFPPTEVSAVAVEQTPLQLHNACSPDLKLCKDGNPKGFQWKPMQGTTRLAHRVCLYMCDDSIWSRPSGFLEIPSIQVYIHS